MSSPSEEQDSTVIDARKEKGIIAFFDSRRRQAQSLPAKEGSRQELWQLVALSLFAAIILIVLISRLTTH